MNEFWGCMNISEFYDNYQKYKEIREQVYYGVCNKHKSIKKLAADVRKMKAQLSYLQPYNANLLDILGVSENGHSAIIGKILQFKHDGVNEFIPSFIYRLLQQPLDFNDKKIKITVEKHRIDIMIRDDKKVLIIENKIHGACDQHEQLRRYIDIAKHYRYKDENIYLIYIQGSKSDYYPKESLSHYYESFKDRLRVASFHTDILSWIENDVAPNIQEKDEQLYYFINQYIDHLKGIYSIRIKDESINMKLNDYIFESMQLDINNKEQNIIKLQEDINVISDLQNRLNRLLQEQKESIFDDWFDSLKNNYPELDVRKNVGDQLTKVGVIFNFKGNKISALIEKNNSSIYFGLGKHFTEDNNLNAEMKKISTIILDGGFKLSEWWYGWKYTSYENAFSDLCHVIDETLNMIKEN
ncbi:PD-(D/E)XK nuclease family protein [Providencia alcalifaciens]